MATPDKPVGGPGSFFIFDAYNFIFRAYHALPMLNAPDGTPTNAVLGFAKMVQAARRDFVPERLVAVFDAGGDGGRKETFAEYKAQRPPPPDDLIPQFDLVRQAIDAFRIRRVEAGEYEADDIIAAYALQARKQGIAVTVISSDKDLMQLCVDEGDDGPPIVLYDTMKFKVIGPAEVEAKFGVRPEKLGDLLALTGDSSDNIPGVPGIGPKTAAGLLGEYGDLEGVLAAAPEIKQKKRRERLMEHADDARLSRELVALRSDIEVPLPLDELVDPGVDDQVLIDFFEPLGFNALLREMGVTGRVRKDVVPTGGAAPAAEGDPGAVELLRVEGFEAPAGRSLMAGDEAELEAFAKALPDRLAIWMVTDASGRGETEAILGADPAGIAIAADGIEPTYVPFGHKQVDLVEGRQLSGTRCSGRYGACWRTRRGPRRSTTRRRPSTRCSTSG